MKVKFIIKGAFYGDKTLPSLNDYLNELGRNPLKGGEMKRKYMNIIIRCVRADLRQFSTKDKVVINYRFFEPNSGQIRDVMNIFSLTDKFVEDALVKLKVLPDDSPKYVVNTTHEFTYTNGTPFIEVEIEELEESKNAN